MTESHETDHAEAVNAAQPGLLDLRSACRRPWHIAGCTFFSLAAGVAYLLVATPTYQARARVLVQHDGLSFERPDRSQVDKEFLATQAEIIRSPLTVARALETVNVTMSPDDPRDPVTFVLESLKVVPKVETDIVSIEYHSPVETEAPQVIQAIIDSYIQVVQETSRGDFTRSLDVLQRAEETVRKNLESLQDQHVRLRISSPIIGRGRDAAGVDTTRIQELSKQLSDTRTRRIALVERQKQALGLVPASITRTSLTSQDGSSDPTVPIDDALMRLLREENIEAANDVNDVQQHLALAQTRLREISRNYGPLHPDYRSAESHLSAWQEIYELRLAALGDVLNQELQIARAAEEELERIYSKERDEVKQMDSLLTEEQILLSNVARVERLHDAALDRLTEFRLADEAMKEGRAAVYARVVEGPALTEKLIWPVKGPILGASLILGLVLGMLVASSRQYPLNFHLTTPKQD